MKNLILTIVAFSACSFASAQKFGFVDTDYVLSQMPEYRSAQKQIDELSNKWQKEADDKKASLDQMYKDYNAEKLLLTPQQCKEREDEIVKTEDELYAFQQEKFGPEGELFKKRQEFVKPVQDKVYSAIQKVAKENGLDFIFDKSGDLIMLYSNPKYDKSDLVLSELGIASTDEPKDK